MIRRRIRQTRTPQDGDDPNHCRGMALGYPVSELSCPERPLTCRHWLFIGNVGMILFATLPVLAPILAALGFEGISLLIFQVYSLTCHQMPDRSYFLFGHQMA